MLFNPVVIRSLCYAGLISSVLAILVCYIFQEYEPVMAKGFSLLIWSCVYYLHKKRGTW